jgi:hypothetical protein
MNTVDFLLFTVFFFAGIITVILGIPNGVNVTTYLDNNCNDKYSPEPISFSFSDKCAKVAPNLYINVLYCEPHHFNKYALYNTIEECVTERTHDVYYSDYDNVCTDLKSNTATVTSPASPAKIVVSIKVKCELHSEMGNIKNKIFTTMLFIYFSSLFYFIYGKMKR